MDQSRRTHSHLCGGKIHLVESKQTEGGRIRDFQVVRESKWTFSPFSSDIRGSCDGGRELRALCTGTETMVIVIIGHYKS